MKKTKRYNEANKKITRETEYLLDEAIGLVKTTATAKFDETFEATIVLGVDPRHADQNIRGTVSLPFGTGKTKRVLVLTQGSKEDEAKEAGADFVGLDEYIKKLQDGWVDIEAVIATPDVMGKVGKLGKLLGPRGLMPSPKSGTVTMDVAKAVNEIKAGRIEFRVDKTGILHVGLGKLSFEENKLKDNIVSFVNTVLKLKPASAKGDYVKKIVLSATMGPGVKVNHTELLQTLK
jgi:large subunit ribosomal protein L1